MKTVQTLKSELIQFHAKEGFEIYESFPLLSNDPTLLFTNATITPFKDRHLGIGKATDYALIQKCFRTGGATNLEEIGTNEQCFTYFEMFGAGIFSCTCERAISYLTRMMASLGIDADNIYYVIPTTGDFLSALIDSNVDRDKIFLLDTNRVYWVDWRFGLGGPVGKGITIVYSQCGNRPISVSEMESSPDDYIELLNLIHISAVEKDGVILPCAVPAYDLGVGIERLAAVVQGCSPYKIDTIKPIVDMVRRSAQGLDEAKRRMLADHLRACVMLVHSGCQPSNKKAGYVLRRLIRRSIEATSLATKAWSSDVMTAMTTDTISILEKTGQGKFSKSEVVAVIEREALLFKVAVRSAIKALAKNPGMSDDQFRSTFGISRQTTVAFTEVDIS